MAQPLSKRLQMKIDQRIVIVNTPTNFYETLGELPEGTHLMNLPRQALDFALLFAQNSSDLKQYGPEIISSIKKDGLLWFAYPKKSSGLETDLTRDEGWAIVTQAGYRGIRQISIDETWSAVRFRPLEHESDQDVIDAQYAGKKAELRPIYERITEIVMGLSDDVKFAPRKSYVAFDRKKQFALVAPSTNTRVDLGLKLPGFPFTDRLADGANVGSGSITHKVALTSLADVDQQVIDWLSEAYENGV